jgi:hypothetical protein
MINDYIKKLRKAADVLEDLLTSNPFDHPTAATAIGKRVEKNLGGVRPGYTYNGTHWTQRPENKARLKQVVAKQHQARAKGAPPVKGTRDAPPLAPPVKLRHYAPGQHWTQKPENQAKLQRLLKKAARSRRQRAGKGTV